MIVEAELLHEVGAHDGIAVEQQQAGLVLVAQAELALGAEDPLRLDAVDLLCGDDAEARQRRSGRREGRARAGPRVRRAAHDAEALRAARADAADHQAMAAALAELALDAFDLADHHAAQPRRRQRRDARDLEAGVDETISGVLRRELDVHELANPPVGNLHGNDDSAAGLNRGWPGLDAEWLRSEVNREWLCSAVNREWLCSAVNREWLRSAVNREWLRSAIIMRTD